MMRIKRRILTKVLVCALVLVVVGAGSWFYLHRDTGPAEPMCLALTRQDVRPLVGEAESASDGRSSEPYGHFWICSVSGGPMTLSVEASSNAERGLSHYKDLRASLLETVTAHRGGVSEPVPSIDATVVSWLQGRRVCAGWFEGDSAVILSLSMTTPDDDQARSTLIGYFDELTRLLKRRAHQLLEAAGFAPPLTMRTPPPAATDEPDPQQTSSPIATAAVTGGPSQTPSSSPPAGIPTPPPRAPADGTGSPSQTPATNGRATDGPG